MAARCLMLVLRRFALENGNGLHRGVGWVGAQLFE
jgi:hypothetical protein